MSVRAGPALAQAVNDASGAASDKQIAQNGQPSCTQTLDPPPVERLVGDWDNPQSRLWQDAVNLQFDALTEFAGNVRGGVKQGSTFASLLASRLRLRAGNPAG